ncbi:MAG: tRNA (adenosine(37)-N6)-dimethylallyltransferase MiaA [Chloroflexi bacterium]|nr:tRNA (adenosine(37)-N6)-dimethylallyltransferase MiaA [Chloroflexota bacterium]
MNKPLIAIVGPTAVGKTGLAIEIAQRIDGEIVNADSRQIYRYMDIGTAKPTPEEQTVVPHHLFDIIDPDEEFSLALYRDSATKSISDIHKKEKLPIIVGGSGQYIWGILEGWTIPEVPPNPQLRQELESRAECEGGDTLYQELQNLDPEAAAKIDPRNVRRVIRALEVCHSTGELFSDLRKKNPPDYDMQILGLTTDRTRLYDRIDRRVDIMIEQGFVEEVRGLLERGYSLDLPAMSSLGYREIGRFINGEIDLPEVSQQIKFATHKFARHQYSWFRLSDSRIQWFDIGEDNARIVAQVEANVRYL